jgi:uncharacterized protein YdhG (YjbR/CyaY superfamily)
MTKAKSVDEYLARVPPEQRAALQKLREQITSAAPGVVERIAWGVPMFQVNGKYVGGFAAYAEHLSFAPWGGWSRVVPEKELKGIAHTAGTIQFTAEKPLPDRLVKKLVKLTIKANEARAAD